MEQHQHEGTMSAQTENNNQPNVHSQCSETNDSLRDEDSENVATNLMESDEIGRSPQKNNKNHLQPTVFYGFDQGTNESVHSSTGADVTRQRHSACIHTSGIDGNATQRMNHNASSQLTPVKPTQVSSPAFTTENRALTPVPPGNQ